MNSAVILAAGSSKRMGRQGKKELLLLDGRPVLLHSLTTFLETKLFDQILIAYPKDFKDSIAEILPHSSTPLILVEGGETRQDSVRNCLETMKGSEGTVLIHDGARPWVSAHIIQQVVELTKKKQAAIPVEPSTSAMKTLSPQGEILEHLNRQSTWAAQTPQGFLFPEILQAHYEAEESGLNYIDDSEIWHAYKGTVWTVESDPENKKITYQGDI